MTKEIQIKGTSGWGVLPVTIIMWFVTIGEFIYTVWMTANNQPLWYMWVLFPILFLITLLLTLGFYVLQPNEAAALVLFGHYKGSVKENGFLWRNPFISVRKISLRARNLNGDRLKVNDKVGNPIEIAAVVVWKVEETAEALFNVDDYEEYVEIQSDAAIRHLAGRYPYDTEESEDAEISLREGRDEVNEELKKELQERLGCAGVVVQEARISHLAYAPEIAGAMLRRQQAQAVIAARKKIVEGAVSMVEMALTQLSEKHVVDLDEERKASMVSNLLVVLCGEESAQPVVNTGTLYS
ncbi:MAG TPA: SPFH domain-containing protein [bacterium]|nr:SPFH domain-containing protein [bacterium]